MPNTTILVPDINKGETNDTPKKFTNIDTEDFEFSWDNIKTIVPVGQTIDLPLYKVNYAAMHLARKILKRENMKEAEARLPNQEFLRQGMWKVKDEAKELELQKKIVAINLEGVPTPEIPVAPNTEAKKEEVQETNPLQCKTCGFIAKSSFGLEVHKRKHK